jgi:peptide/nickel transport system substrate-binding protein
MALLSPPTSPQMLPTWDPATGSSTGYLALQKVTAVTAVSADVARFTLDPRQRPARLAFPALARHRIRQRTEAQPGGELRESPVGTGPFAVKKWTHQQSISLVRNADFSSPRRMPPASRAYLKRVSTGDSCPTRLPATPRCRPAPLT